MSTTRALHTAIDDCTRMVRKLREQTAELVAVCEAALEESESLQPEGLRSIIEDRLRAAIRKVKGESP